MNVVLLEVAKFPNLVDLITPCLRYTAEMSTLCREILQEKACCRLYVHFSADRSSQVLWIYVEDPRTYRIYPCRY